MKSQSNTNITYKRPYKKPSETDVGYIAECHVVLELAKKGVFSSKIHKDYHYDYDLILSNGMRVEVKCSNIIKHKDHRRPNNYSRKIWAFNNAERYYVAKKGLTTFGGRYRYCDYYVLVCMDKMIPQRYYIVPTDVIQARQIITIPVERKYPSKFSLEEFKNKWELIVNAKRP